MFEVCLKINFAREIINTHGLLNNNNAMLSILKNLQDLKEKEIEKKLHIKV
jgi:hypothetical protein